MLVHPQFKVWQFVQQCLLHKSKCALLYVLESNGSSPGRQGFCMAINEQHEMIGSIGGGIMEHKLVELAKEKLKGFITISGSDIKKQVHNKDAGKNQSGMICSGEQTVFIYTLRPSDIGVINALIDCLKKNMNGLLELNEKGIYFSFAAMEVNYVFSITDEHNWVYKEKIGYKNKLFVIGAGHCSLAFCKLMSSMDFYIQLFDDRTSLNTFSQNEYVHEKTIVADYTALKDLISSGKNHYIVVMTFGYRTDDIALKALLNMQFAYLGVLGSKQKINTMFEEYKHQNINESLLQSIYAPIGLPIHSKTPEEIAISIAAEIIQVKNA